jgi:hypothetical protein
MLRKRLTGFAAATVVKIEKKEEDEEPKNVLKRGREEEEKEKAAYQPPVNPRTRIRPNKRFSNVRTEVRSKYNRSSNTSGAGVLSLNTNAFPRSPQETKWLRRI